LFTSILKRADSISPQRGIPAFYLPEGNGPFPIVFFLHGQLNLSIERSEMGYDKLCEMLASNGIIGVTIDENWINSGGTDFVRPIILLEHIKQFLAWDTTSLHPLNNKIDTNNIMLVGHSRGGEAVVNAAYFNYLSLFDTNRLFPSTYNNDYPENNMPPFSIDGTGQFGPYKFNLKGIVAIAPTTNDPFTMVAVQAGFSNSELENDPKINQDFSLQLKDLYGNSYALSASSTCGKAAIMPFQSYFTAHELSTEISPGIKIASYPIQMQTVRFPLSAFNAKGVDVSKIKEITILFDCSAKGKLYIDDIQLTR
jgi:hypothetical protein